MTIFRHALVLAILFVSGCGNGGTSGAGEGEVRLLLDKNDNRRLLEFYLGGMAGERARDPFEAGFVRETEGSWFLSVDLLSSTHPFFADDLGTIAADGTIDWDEFEAWILRHYYRVRSAPASRAELQDLTGDWTLADEWLRVPVQGVMSPHARVIHVRHDAVLSALQGYSAAGERLVYPVGTAFVSEHLEDGLLVELAVMLKREDGYWDFFGYGRDGRLAAQLEKEPRPLDVPTKCVGCHFGSRLFEPEKSFPATPRPGPDGPRAITLDTPAPSLELVTLLDEHRKRSDLVLGLYGTLTLNRLRQLDQDGRLPPEQSAILDAFRDAE